MERKIYTHVNVDLDAACSVWAVRNFVPGFSSAEVEFVHANWDGKELNDKDIAVDLEAGIKGRKDGTTRSAFATIVARYADEEDQKALENLVQYVDAQDSYGSAVEYFIPNVDERTKEVFSSNGINTVLRALQAQYRDDKVVLMFGEILDGLYKMGLSKIRAIKEAEWVGPVALIYGAKEFGTNGELFKRGAKAIVYIDGYNIGVIKASTVEARMDHPYIRNVIGSEGWFFHPAGFMAAWGSRKSPATTPSRVDPKRLAEVVAQVVGGE
ncbi:MAG: hypothetical protein KatS3mg002_0380 [Candidatus Woesearchaeota archaeon]|nr:MAG: hypothetical protein KatS3mg002_0380 [Candidatus Woesearchaeota archaeon]